MSEITVAGHTIRTSNEARVLFPSDGLTKGDVIGYYTRIAPHMLPHIRRRRLTLQRFHSGILEPGIFQKDIPSHFPDWIHRVTVPKHGGTVTHVVCDDAATLVYIANQGCLTPHVGLARTDRIEFPDQMVFDLDPSDDDFELVRSVAFSLRELLEEAGLNSFVKTTGSRGLHVMVPLDRKNKFDHVHAFAWQIAMVLVRRRPADITTEFMKNKRGKRLFLDTNRNGMAQTVVPAFAIRAKDGAPVSMPIDWDELKNCGLNARSWRMENASQRMQDRPDPWRNFARSARSLSAAADRLAKLL